MPQVYCERVRIKAAHLSAQVTGKCLHLRILWVHLANFVSPKAVVVD